GVLDRLLGEVAHAARLQRLVKTPYVVRVENERAHGALGDELPQLRGGRLVVKRRSWLLEEDLDLVAREPHRQPAEGPLPDVLGLLEAELVHVEVERLVLVEDLDRGDVQLGG